MMSGEAGTLLTGQVSVTSDPWALPEKHLLIKTQQKENVIELKMEA
jgi:hypothetical protein